MTVSNFMLFLAFNKANRITELCCLILIKNENTETIEEIFHFLTKEYSFQP